jgi:hypothetical protein
MVKYMKYRPSMLRQKFGQAAKIIYVDFNHILSHATVGIYSDTSQDCGVAQEVL